MSIASSICAENVNRTGKKAIKEMEKLKKEYYTESRHAAIDECIEIVKKRFTGWTE